MNIIQKTIMVSALGLALAINSNAQTNLQFTAATSTDEQAIRLTWASQSNHVYQIQCANALATNANGSTAWQLLYDDYPSQGTNTFWLDTGNYNLAPQVLHPKYMPMRFYRILDEGQDSLTDVPTVTIDSLTNNMAATGELTFTATAATDQPGLRGTILYVDGQEMQAANTTTNYTIGSTNYETDTYSINTCEWLNETHVLFATTEAASQYSSQMNGGAILTGHAVSSFVSILFSNLIEEISFSQPSFNPSLGQTQQVSAVFAANSDWTLNIVDVYSNVVQTASGSGTSMLYNWDGTSNGTNLPNGIYYYYISAQTNGGSSDFVSGGSSGGSGGSVPSPSLAGLSGASSATELWAVPADLSDGPVPLALYPPGVDTNGLTIFAASPAEIQSLRPSVSRTSFSAMKSGGGFSPAASGGGSSAASQSSPASPQRPPNNPIRGLVGTFGIAYDTYSANGTNGISVGPLDDGLGIGLDISMDGNAADQPLTYSPLPAFPAGANNFISAMQYWGWTNVINKKDDQLNINDLRGSGTPFNQVDLGVLMCHGAYGESVDYAANGCLQMYYPITSGGSGQYLRLSEMNLGGGGTHGLKWFAILACDSLNDFNWDDMQNNVGVYPYNGNLHLLLGTDSSFPSDPRILENWARYMSYSRGAYFNPMTIREAWYAAAGDAFQWGHYTNYTKIVFAVAGDSACMGDYVFPGSYSSPSGNWIYDSRQVWP